MRVSSNRIRAGTNGTAAAGPVADLCVGGMKTVPGMKLRIAFGLLICAILIFVLIQPPENAGPQSVAVYFIGRDKANPGRLAFRIENNGPASITLDECGYEMKTATGVVRAPYVDVFASSRRSRWEGPILGKGEAMTVSLSDPRGEARARLVYAVDMSLGESVRILWRDIVPLMIKNRAWVGFRRKIADRTLSDWIDSGKMRIVSIVIVGYLGLGLLTGFVNCAFKTRFYRRHPSSRLTPPDNAACDFLFRSMFFWPWFVASSLYAALTGQKGRAEK